MSRAPKLAIIGLDSADWSLMDPWLQAGKLPHLAALIESGCRAPLLSTPQPSTACAWPSIMTGVNPGKNGVFGFVQFEGDYTPRLMSNLDRQAPAIWDLVAEHGLTVGVYNVPMTYPPNEVNGYLIGGEIGSVEYDESLCRPSELFAELAEVVPPDEYEITPVHQRGGELDLDGFRRQILARRKIATHLLDHHPTDVFIAVINYVDHMQHRRLGKRRYRDTEDVILLAYQAADELVGSILKRCDEDTAILVISDHGSGPIEGYFDLNALLATMGYLHYKPEAVAQFEAQASKAAAARKRWAISKHIPPSVKNLARRLLGRGKAASKQSAQPVDRKRDHFAVRQNARLMPAIDWERTQAYSAGLYLSVRLNLEGREEQGIVRPDDYERLRAEIVERMAEVVNPFSGEHDLGARPVNEVYSGEHMQWAPDILGAPQGGALTLKNLPGNERQPFMSGTDMWAGYPGPEGVPGTHRMHGIFIARAPGRIPSLTVDDANVMDVAATALGLLGLPLPAHMDGRVILDLPEVESDGTAGASWQRADEADGYDDDDERKVVDRLKDLGYL